MKPVHGWRTARSFRTGVSATRRDLAIGMYMARYGERDKDVDFECECGVEQKICE